MEAGDRPDNVVVNWVTCNQKKPNPDRPKMVWDDNIGNEFYYNIKTNEMVQDHVVCVVLEYMPWYCEYLVYTVAGGNQTLG